MVLPLLEVILTLVAPTPAPAAPEQEKLPQQLISRVIADNYHDHPGKLPLAFEYYRVDLNDDGDPEYMIEGSSAFCGSAGCAVWIYRRTEDTYEMIFDGDGVTSNVGLFPQAVLPAKTNGFRDLLFKDEPWEAGPFFQVIYFDGKKYVRYKDCDPEASQ